MYCLPVWRPEVRDQGVGRAVPLEGSREGPVQASPSFWWFPGLWQQHSHPHVAFSLGVCLCVPNFPFLGHRDIGNIGSKPTPMTSFYLAYLYKDLISKKGHILRSGGLGWQNIFFKGHNSTCNSDDGWGLLPSLVTTSIIKVSISWEKNTLSYLLVRKESRSKPHIHHIFFLESNKQYSKYFWTWSNAYSSVTPQTNGYFVCILKKGQICFWRLRKHFLYVTQSIVLKILVGYTFSNAHQRNEV